MFKDEEGFSRGESKWFLHFCCGESPIVTQDDLHRTSIGHTLWDQQSFDVCIEITKSGVARWVVLTNGIILRCRPTKWPAFATAGSQLTAHIKAG